MRRAIKMKNFLFFLLFVFSNSALAAIPTGNIADVQGYLYPVRSVSNVAVSTAGNASIVIDAADRFGNRVIRTVPASFGRLRFAAFARLCLGSPILCGAAAVITAAALTYGYELINNELIKSEGIADCPSSTVPKDDGSGGTVQAIGPLPCQFTIGGLHIKTPNQESSYTGASENYISGWYFTTGSGTASYGYYEYIWPVGSQDAPTGVDEPLTDDDYWQLIADSPNPEQMLQVDVGEYPTDLWDPIDLAAAPVDPPTAEETQQEAEQEQQLDDLMERLFGEPEAPDQMPDYTMDDLPSQQLDIFETFINVAESPGWLPRDCPSDVQVDVMGGSFAIPYSFVCTAANYMGPLVIAFASLTSLFIVVRGISA